MQRQIMTVKETALYLGVHQDTIYKMVNQKKLPHFRIKSKILFSQAAITSWIHEQEMKNIGGV